MRQLPAERRLRRGDHHEGRLAGAGPARAVPRRGSGELDQRRTALVRQVAPQLLAAHGVGPHTAATLLVTVGDNPDRLRNEATFARLCGVAPIPAGSGQTDGNHRLHRGGDRQASSALWTIVLSRMATEPRTRAYVARRTKEGKQTGAIMRCLKRHVAREIFKLLPRQEGALTT